MCLCFNYVNKKLLYVFVLYAVYFKSVLVYSDKIYFPDEFNNFKGITRAKSEEQSVTNQSIANQEDEDIIPMDIIQKLNSIENASQLFEEFDIKESTKNSKGGIYSVASRFRTSPYLSDVGGVEEEVKVEEVSPLGSSSDTVARSANTRMAPPAICSPELRTISLYTPTDRKVFAFPSCTRVQQCGGCCQHELLSCQPVETETLNYQVLLMQYIGNNKFNQMGREIVSVEKHTKCKCNCIVKKDDCTTLQEYRENECRCVCTNKDEQSKCSLEGEKKLWDPESCSCKCRDIRDCSSGQFFNDATCNCQTIRNKIRGSSSEERYDYNIYKIIPDFSVRRERHQV